MNEEIKPLHKGNRKKCIACGAGPAITNFVFAPADGVMGGQVCNTRFKHDYNCTEERDHLHQKCSSCNHHWIVGFAGDEQ